MEVNNLLKMDLGSVEAMNLIPEPSTAAYRYVLSVALSTLTLSLKVA